MKEITVNELRNLSNINIIDIRSTEKYNDNHILNAYNIPYNNLIINYKKYLDKTKIYYIYCQRGKTSLNVCLLLTREGYNVINIKGGYESWILAE